MRVKFWGVVASLIARMLTVPVNGVAKVSGEQLVAFAGRLRRRILGP